MSSIVVIGAQWGDEGKGRFVDFLAGQADLVVRYSGGNNAGHTVEVGDVQYKLHLVPSGVIYGDRICIIGNGLVVDPEVLLVEMEKLESQGLSMAFLRISDRAQVLMPYHRVLDGLSESARGNGEIGTTKRGIGPAYMDKVERSGIRFCDLLDKDVFAELLKRNVEEKNKIIALYGGETLNYEDIYEKYTAAAERLRPHVCDTVALLQKELRKGSKVLFEGAQGMLLDIDLGTYPYVTSSNPIAGGVCTGAGVGPTQIGRVMGVAKAYTTRVGKGPFPTELLDDMGQAIREKGNEYGTTTGRPRRCGWFDAVIVRFAVQVNGCEYLAVSRMDTLGGFDKVKICTGYELNGKTTLDFPASLKDLEKCKPIYEELEGWTDDISHVRNFNDLPKAAKAYIHRIEELTGAKVAMIGVGAERAQVIVREQELF